MTKKEFKQALLRGQGRCVQAAREHPERYRSVILWACTSETAYDVQCEGSRAWFVYQLIKCFPDHTPFLDAVIEHFDRAADSGRVCYAAELLRFFAKDGEKQAEEALWRKYECLYRSLLDRVRRPKGIFSKRADFGHLCWLLAERESAVTRIAEDIGRLYRENRCYNGSDFDWFYEDRAKGWLPALTRQAGQSENVAEYLRISREWEAEQEKIRNRSEDVRPRKGFGFSRWLKEHGSREEILRYAEDYLEQTDPDARAEALSVFGKCPFPADPAPVIADAGSAHERLLFFAWTALEHIRHPDVRELALANLEDCFEEAWPVFLANYQPGDRALAEQLLKSVPVEERADGPYWHGVHCAVLDAADRGGVKLPGELFLHIYETTRCACCRLAAVEQLDRMNLLTDSLLAECLLDSYGRTRELAFRKISPVPQD